MRQFMLFSQRGLKLLLFIAVGFIVSQAPLLSVRHSSSVGQHPVGASSTISSEIVSRFLNARTMQAYEQPSPDLVQRISRVYSKEEAPGQPPPRGTEGLDLLLIDDVPFYPYWQGKEGEYVFHPMAYGLFLIRLDCSNPIEKYLDAAVHTAHELPDGGLLWYYPDNYQLNRFLGPDLHPSAIAQAVILGGILHLDKKCNIDLSSLARRIFLGLKYDYYKGGLNLEDSALLEIPLFRSAPEIVLNGWLHALLYLHQYAEYYEDQEAYALLQANLRFLAQVIRDFHDHRTGLSLYSDLTPYRVKVQPRLNALKVFYKARNEGFDDLVFDLKAIDHPTRSPYDNQIVRETASYMYVQVSCSQRYDTYLVTEEGPFTVTFATGTYSPMRATPDIGGEEITLSSKEIEGYHLVHITEVRDKLFCGFPTNFVKMGRENYYHTYHIVALACILATMDLEGDVREIFTRQVVTWMQTTEIYEERGFKFTDYQTVLDELVQYSACIVPADWPTLLNYALSGGRGK